MITSKATQYLSPILKQAARSKSNFVSSAVKNIEGSHILKISQHAEKLKLSGKEVISLTVGQSDFAVHPSVKKSVISSLLSAENIIDGYQNTLGISKLRDGISQKFRVENNLHYDPDEIIVTVGAKQALTLSLQALLNQDDEVVIFKPYYTTYKEIIPLFHGKIISIDCNKQLRPNIHEIGEKITEKTKVIIINSPCNPSGIVYTREELEMMIEILLQHPQIVIISDDIYENIAYGEKSCNILELDKRLYDRTLVINSFSKGYSMPGWRVGYIACSNPDILKALNCLQSHTIVSPSAISQIAAAAALMYDNETQTRRNIFKVRRDEALKILSRSNKLECVVPDGAFYLFVSCEKLINGITGSGKIIKDDITLCELLLEDECVATVPGSAFGMPGYIRISFACEIDLIRNGCERIVNWSKDIEIPDKNISDVKLSAIASNDVIAR